MKTMRLFFMLLVMLGSVTGAWALSPKDIKVTLEFNPDNNTITYSAVLVGEQYRGYGKTIFSSGHDILLQSIDGSTTYEKITVTNSVWSIKGSYDDTLYRIKISEGTFMWRNMDDFEHPLISPELNDTIQLCYRRDYDANGFCIHCHSPQVPKKADGGYQIANGGNMMWYGMHPDDNAKLVADIVLNTKVFNIDNTPMKPEEVENLWQPMRLENRTFDGNGHSVSGVYVNMDATDVGFISIAKNSTIKLLTLRNSYVCNSTAMEPEEGLLHVGGIAGAAENSTFLGCHNAAVVETKCKRSGIGGICGDAFETSFVSCMNSGKVIGFNPLYGICGQGVSTNGACLEGTATQVAGEEQSNCFVTYDDMRNGMATFHLNGGVTDGSQCWYQKLGTDQEPHNMARGGDTVYKLVNCLGDDVYLNISHLDEDNHLFDKDTRFCIYCDAPEKAHLAQDGCYEISYLGHLAWFRDYAAEHTDADARLMNDIVMNADIRAGDLYEWTAITGLYSGTFDGQGHTIHGLYGDGLFDGLKGATVKRLGIVDYNVVSPVFGFLVTNGSHIKNCLVRETMDISAKREMVDAMTGYSAIENCLAINPDRSVIVKSVDSHSYVRNSAVLAGDGSTVAENAKAENIVDCGIFTLETFRGGSVTWLINDGVTDGTQAWYQQLGRDDMPVYDNSGYNTVYSFTNCKGSVVYENAPDYEGHLACADGPKLVCQYCGAELPGEADHHDYMAFTAVGGSVTIGMAKTGKPDDYILQFSKTKAAWTTIVLGATNDNIVTLKNGETCYFRHGTQTVTEKISTNQNNHWSFTMTGDGSITANGNVMSLLDATCKKNGMGGYPNQHMFTGLFKGCEKLTVAPKLPAKTLGQFCYMYMFEGTSITDAPELPATTIPDGAYDGMFRNCKNLKNVSPLPGTKLARRAYREMFYGCERLTTLHIAMITTIDPRDDESNASFNDWLAGTAVGTTGTLYMPDSLLGNPLIFLPENWREVGETDPTGFSVIYPTYRHSWKSAGSIYNLAGQRLSIPQRGKINIINGKKILVK